MEPTKPRLLSIQPIHVISFGPFARLRRRSVQASEGCRPLRHLRGMHEDRDLSARGDAVEDWRLAAFDSTSVNCGGIQEENHARDEASSRFSLASDWEYAGGTAAEGRIAVYGRGSGEVGVLQSHRLLQRSHGVG